MYPRPAEAQRGERGKKGRAGRGLQEIYPHAAETVDFFLRLIYHTVRRYKAMTKTDGHRRGTKRGQFAGCKAARAACPVFTFEPPRRTLWQ